MTVPSMRRTQSVPRRRRVVEAGAQAHYTDPAYYDKTYAGRTNDVAFYRRVGLACGGPVLEYGVGTGRIALPLARSGVEVVGVDLSAPMLRALTERLREEDPAVRRRLRVVRGDMRRVRLRRRFPLVIAPFNAVLHLYTRQDVERFLACVRAHLTPRGRFIFDFSVPSPSDLDADPNRRYGAPRIRHPTTGQLTRYTERFEYDPILQVLLVEMQFIPMDGGPGWTTPLTHRQFFPQEMEALLAYNGFADIEFAADFTEAAPDETTDSLIVTCRAAGGRRAR